MSHHVPGPPDYDVVMTEQVPGLNGPKMLGRHKPTAPNGYYVDHLSAQLHTTNGNVLCGFEKLEKCYSSFTESTLTIILHIFYTKFKLNSLKV